jgi:outer membrane protein assembly factor BamB/DNA-binding MarR family transcriptional regulator
MGGIAMAKKAINLGIVSLFVIGGFVGLFSVVPDEVEGPGPTYVSGLITENTTWIDSNSPYIINGDTTLMSGYTLTIQDGTVVKFSNNTLLAVRGKLHVEGNNANRVVFTANDTLSNFTDERDYDKRYYYNGIGSNFQIFIDAENGGEVNISFAEFEFSSAQEGALRLGSSSEPQIIADTIFKNNRMGLWTGGYYSNINRCTFEDNYMGILNAKGTISNSIFRNNIVGVYSSSDMITTNSSYINNICGLESGKATLEYCIISNNNFGIYELYDSTFNRNSINNNKIGIIPMPDSFPITNNNIYNNTEYNIMLIGSPDINVTNNWWGTTNTTIIDQYIYDIYDDISLGEAFYLPILTAPSPGTPTESSGLQPGAPWPMFRGNVRHTGLSPYDTSGNTGELKWSFATNGSIYSSMAVDSYGIIYTGAMWDNFFYAIYPNGTLKWKFLFENHVEMSCPSIDSNGVIYIGSNDNYLYALYSNGTLKWKYKTNHYVEASPTIGFDGTIYFYSEDMTMYALYPNGTLKWEYSVSAGYSSPAIGTDGTIFFGSQDQNLYSLYPNGTLKWKFFTGDALDYSSPTIASDGTLYIGSLDNFVYAINPNGTLKWNYSTGNRIESTPAIGSDGTIYIGSEDHNIYAIYPNGTLRWNYTTGGVVDSSPAISSEGNIYFGSYDNFLYALYPNGTLKWKFLTGDNIYSSPAIDFDGTIYISSTDGNLYAIGGTPNQSPLTPPIPSGPTSGITNISYSFSTSTTDPEGDQIKYGWDWEGDGIVDVWSNLTDSGIEDNRSHSWLNPGSYSVNVKVQDEFGAESEWSSALIIDISIPPPANQPPYTPPMPSGPVLGMTNTSYEYYTATMEPDRDNMTYGWDWNGDGTVDEWSILVPWLIDEHRSHSWSEPGIYDVRVKAQDEYGEESGWSDALSVTIYLEGIDTDNDGIPDLDDPDDDNDGHNDENDYYPRDSTRWSPLTEISFLNITVSNDDPTEGEGITITVEIQNSDINDNHIIVKFYDGDPTQGGTQIGSIQEMTIQSDSLLTITQNWIALLGTHNIYVVVGHNETNETLSSSLQIEVGEELIPELVLSVGDINMYRFEPGEERTIFVEVTCYFTAVDNVHLEILDDQNLTIDHTITPPRPMNDGETTKFYLRIRAPQLPKGEEKAEWDIKLRAVGDGGISSNSEELDIVVSQNAVSFFNPVTIAGAVATGSLATLGAAAAASRRNENWKYLLLLTFAVPLYTRIKGKKTLDNFVRGQVFGHIQSQPGTHFNDIKKTLQLGNGNLAYHLRKLEKEGFIKSKRDKRYRRFYPVGVEVPEEVGIILSKTQENILDFVEQHPKSGQKEISSNLKESQQTVSYNINVLIREGFLVEEKIKGTKKYRILDENN